jgi:ribosomal L28 family
MPNLRVKRVYSEEQGKWITLKVSVAGLRTINKLGLDAAMRNARKAGYME